MSLDKDGFPLPHAQYVSVGGLVNIQQLALPPAPKKVRAPAFAESPLCAFCL